MLYPHSMHAYTYIYVCVCMYIYIEVYVYVYLSIYISLSAYMHANMQISTYVRLWYLHVLLYVSIYLIYPNLNSNPYNLT